jgi:hypothetical protein
VKYNGIYYFVSISGRGCTLAVTPSKSVAIEENFSRSSFDSRENPESIWGNIILDALKWLKTTQKNWLRANQKVQSEYPLHMRKGKVAHALIRASFKDFYRLDKELGKSKMKKFIKLVEDLKFSKYRYGTRESMTAKDFFDYCKIAYIFGKEKDEHIDENLSGREMYKRYAYNGHSCGISKIDQNSPQEFSDLIDGTHPKIKLGEKAWRIKGGGSATSINLCVSRANHQKEGFEISLYGDWLHRLRETICMALAFYEADLPFGIANPETIRSRLLAQDYIGIVPSYVFYCSARWHFTEKDFVFDTLHLNDLGRYKRRILPFIVWEPLPILKPT